MTDQPKPPLWRVMDEAFARDVGTFSLGDGFGETCGDPDHDTWAAVVRALAAWLVPEEAEPTGMRPAADSYSRQTIRRHQRQELRRILLAEADRAEAGND